MRLRSVLLYITLRWCQSGHEEMILLLLSLVMWCNNVDKAKFQYTCLTLCHHRQWGPSIKRKQDWGYLLIFQCHESIVLLDHSL